MRVLFTCAAELGHFLPLLPVARATVAAGHDVAFAVPQSFRERVETEGFPSLLAGLDRRQIAGELDARFPEWATVPLEDRLRFALANVGARIVAPVMLDHLEAAVDASHADLLVHGPAVFAGPLAAALAGIPAANHSWGPLLDLDDLAAAAEAAAPLWHGRGLDPPPLAGMFGSLYLDICPPSLQTSDIASVPVAHPLRPTAADAIGGSGLPAWVEALPPAPTVLVTLGTFCNRFTHLFATVLEGLADLPVNVIVTVGHDQDPAALGPQPDHVHVASYLPTSLVLRHCRLAVTHGGSGTMLAAVGRGVPLLILPQGHDHARNAMLCEARGVARSLPPEALSAAAVRARTVAMLDDPRYAAAAGAVRDEVSAMPGPEDAVALLERLAAEGRPLVAR
ncbi:MAG TPA: glycosyltransferase [Acidimicrobiales bacterium]|nr:glycosyltransferase [Acidimicrobiales bacterium]